VHDGVGLRVRLLRRPRHRRALLLWPWSRRASRIGRAGRAALRSRAAVPEQHALLCGAGGPVPAPRGHRAMHVQRHPLRLARDGALSL